MLQNFRSNTHGNFAVITALAAMPLVLTVGCAVDGSRWYAAQSYLQNATDLTSLALAASTEQDLGKLRLNANQFLSMNVGDKRVENLKITSFEADEDVIKMKVTGNTHAMFMSILNYDVLEVSAAVEAKRAPIRKVEVALVLDNTYSMVDADAKGVTKISALKTAATNLIDTLLPAKDDALRIGIVPYANYVNVGTQYRKESWLKVDDDYSTTSTRTCKDVYSETVCKTTAPSYACTETVDGVIINKKCAGACLESTVKYYDPPKQSCSGGSTTNYKWYGCVGSRMSGTARLNDQYLSVTYPGRLATSLACPAQLKVLTNDEVSLKATIAGLYTNIDSGYRPLTYIPAGLIWGQNMLSPDTPLAEADPYDMRNIAPRKIMILMTDGENTLKYSASDGAHIGFSSNTTAARTEFVNVNNESNQICDYSKSKKIEIFTVAFMVDDDDAKKLLLNCATDKTHYYDASDSAKLIAAFDGIARSVSQVRLAE